MSKFKVLMLQEELTVETMPERIRKKIGQHDAIENGKGLAYRNLKTGVMHQKCIDQMAELDEDICDLIYDYIAETEEAEYKRLEEQSKQQQSQEAEEAERQRLLDEEEAERQNQRKRRGGFLCM